MNCCGGQHASIAWPPFTFRWQLRPVFEFSPLAPAGPKAAAVGNKDVGLSGELVRAQHTVILLPGPRVTACGRHVVAHVQIIMCQVPRVMLHMQAVRMKSLQATDWIADLAPVHVNYWQSTDTNTIQNIYTSIPDLNLLVPWLISLLDSNSCQNAPYWNTVTATMPRRKIHLLRISL